MPGQGRQGRSDAFQRKARREGYRARSAYKLMDIQKRSKIFKDGSIVLDLGAAPGGWSQVALEYIGEEGKLVGLNYNTFYHLMVHNLFRAIFGKKK